MKTLILVATGFMMGVSAIVWLAVEPDYKSSRRFDDFGRRN